MRSPGSAGLRSTQVGLNWEAWGGRDKAKVTLQHAASTVAGLHSITASLSSGSSFDVSAPHSVPRALPWVSAAQQGNLRVEG